MAAEQLKKELVAFQHRSVVGEGFAQPVDLIGLHEVDDQLHATLDQSCELPLGQSRIEIAWVVTGEQPTRNRPIGSVERQRNR
jgi:hypothetical protein